MIAEDNELDILELEDNLEDIEKPPELPPGMYTAEVQDVQKAVSQNKGNNYYAIRLHIPESEIAPDVKADFPDGATLSWNRQVIPKKGDRRALFSLRKLIEAMGLNAATTTVDPNEWMGCHVRVKVRHKPYEGEMRAEIQAIEAAEAPSRNGKVRKQEVTEDEDEEAPPPRGVKRGAGAKPAGRTARR
jgi:hypothetical protein